MIELSIKGLGMNSRFFLNEQMSVTIPTKSGPITITGTFKHICLAVFGLKDEF